MKFELIIASNVLNIIITGTLFEKYETTYEVPGFRAAQASGWPGLDFSLILNCSHELFDAK